MDAASRRNWVKGFWLLLIVLVSVAFFAAGFKKVEDKAYVTDPEVPLVVHKGETIVIFDRVDINEVSSSYPWKFESTDPLALALIEDPFEAQVVKREFSLEPGRWQLTGGDKVTIDFASQGGRVTILAGAGAEFFAFIMLIAGVIFAMLAFLYLRWGILDLP